MFLIAEGLIYILWVRLVALALLGALFHSRPRLTANTTQPSSKSPASVAVVVPAFNEAETIEATISALLAQSMAPDEIIVVDDGSTDATRTIAHRMLAGTDIGRVVALETNQGKAVALNAGISLASSSLIATVDADTALSRTALETATSELQIAAADAVAFAPSIDCKQGSLAALQAHEYSASLNFDRAGQGRINAISVLPGAATLFDRSALPAEGFSGRTRTEDADLTLWLARRGQSRTLATSATAVTLPPLSIAALIAQRTRWCFGHLQCVWLHAQSVVSASPGARLTYLNFTLGAVAPLAALIAVLMVQTSGGTPATGMSWIDVVAVSAALIYAQRTLAIYVGAAPYPGTGVFLLEPPFSAAVATLATCLAMARLLTLKVFGVGERSTLRNVDLSSPAKELLMDKEHIKGAAKKAEGEVKEKAGELLDDTSLKAKGKTDKAEGEVREKGGDIKDKLTS